MREGEGVVHVGGVNAGRVAPRRAADYIYLTRSVVLLLTLPVLVDPVETSEGREFTLTNAHAVVTLIHFLLY
jgi:hypothetical protein